MIKYLSLFSGIGAFESALTNLGVDYEVVNYCEIDKYASKSYSAIHGVPETKNLWDITKVNVFNLPKPNTIDLITYGFPCQDISLAGNQKGLFNEDGTLTRSGLFFEALKVIEYCKPKVAIAENVKNLTSKKFATQFETVLKSLEEAGYNNYWKVLNAKDYGIPQNRERVFIVSIRKDVDNELFEFPKPYSLEKRLKDFLEPHVDEKYYLSDNTIKSYETHKQRNKENGNGFGWNPTDGEGIAFTLQTTPSKSNSNYIIVPTKTKKGYKDPKCVITKWSKNKNVSLDTYVNEALESNTELPCAVDEQNVVIRKDNTVGSLTTNGSSAKRNNRVLQKDLRIRKLTPKECYRLMGFSDEEFERAENVPTSNTQLYKQAGNSIVVDVLEELFCMMLDEKGDFYL